ncbi:MAG TPA: ABC transporter permease [Solirubrobacteraceae bacterium]|nr:ABC transporter permease [Solirubrobacteraceae bacterium]
MSLSDLLYLYRARLRARTLVIQELLAILGIAGGVALLFASQVAGTSLGRSVQDLTTQIVGNTQQIQLDTRGPAGVSERLLQRVNGLPGVSIAIPILEQQATIIGPEGEQSIDLIGTDPKLVAAENPRLLRFSNNQLEHLHAIALPAPLAQAIGLNVGEKLTLETGAKLTTTYLGATLQEREIGGLVSSPIAFAPLTYAQHLAAIGPRITRIFVRPAAGRLAPVRAELERLAANANVNVEPADYDARLFAVASTPESQSESLFSAISALVGFLFALTAMLVTVPARRRLIQFLTPHGATWEMTVQILLFDAAVIGTVACILGLALGELLSIAVFHSAPGYLAAAFPVGSQRVVTARSIVLAVGAGLAAATIGVLWPVRDILARPLQTNLHTRTSSRAWALARLAGGIACLGISTTILLARPQSAFFGCVTLLFALVLLLPFLFDAVIKAFDAVQRPLEGAATLLVASELKSSRTRIRALAIAATGAIAVFGSVAIDGAQVNLRRGLDASAHGIDSSADVWVSPNGQTSVLATSPFVALDIEAIRRLPGVRALGIYRGSFLDWGNRRLWVLAPPANSKHPIPPGQLLAGQLTAASAEIRAGGWAVLSQALASEHHLHVGQMFTLPAPHPTRLRVAALTSNLGWPPGSIILASSDYARAWVSVAPSAYQLQTYPNATAAHVRSLVKRLLGPNTGLVVETSAERQRRHYALAAHGLARLGEIRLLVLISGALAVAVAMGSMLWQRRDHFADMKVQGYRAGVLWSSICCECALILGTGCLIGAVFGIAGQLLLSHALATVTGFPISLNIETAVAASSFALVAIVAIAVVSVPGYLVVRVAPRTVSPTQ